MFRTRGSQDKDLPDEIPAVGAVGGLPKVCGHELVTVDLVDPATDSSLPLPRPHALPEHTLFIVFGCWEKIRAEKEMESGLVCFSYDLQPPTAPGVEMGLGGRHLCHQRDLGVSLLSCCEQAYWRCGDPGYTFFPPHPTCNFIPEQIYLPEGVSLLPTPLQKYVGHHAGL